MNSHRWLFVALVFTFLLHLPTVTGFFTHDDFFHFEISRATTAGEFLNFFNPLSAPLGYGWYRPVSNQLYYFLGMQVFGLSAMVMRSLMLVNFLINVILVWYFVRLVLRSPPVADMAAYIYSVSAALFAGIYLVGVQERPLTSFYLLSLIMFTQFIRTRNRIWYLAGSVGFVLALLSKESAVTIPAAYLLVFWYCHPGYPGKKYLTAVGDILPQIGLIGLYLWAKLTFFGLASGDSYIWEFSPRLLNTLAWYGLWAANFPEMLVDYIGPGLHLNPNLIRFWRREILVMLAAAGLIAWQLLKQFPARFYLLRPDHFRAAAFGILWFVITVSPVLGLPWHKFPHYLSVPLAGLVIVPAVGLSRLLNATGRKTVLIVYTLIYLVNFGISTRTHWAYTGQQVAARVHAYLQQLPPTSSPPRTVVFYDQEADGELPWSPALTLKTVLSDNSYFRLFHPGSLIAEYTDKIPADTAPGELLIPARQFLGY